MADDYPDDGPRELVNPWLHEFAARSVEPEVVTESGDIEVSRGSKLDWKGNTVSDVFQVCIQLSENQQRMLSEIAGSDVKELRVSVDELADLAAVIAN